MPLATKELARIEALYDSARELRDLHARITRQIDSLREHAASKTLPRDDTPPLDGPVFCTWRPAPDGQLATDILVTFDGVQHTLVDLVQEVRRLRARGD